MNPQPALLLRSFFAFWLCFSVLPNTNAGLLEYDATIRTDAQAGLKTLATLTNAATFQKTNRLAFAFGNSSGNVSMEFIVEGNAAAGGADAFLAVGANSSSSLRFEQYNNTGLLGFTLNGVEDYLFTPSIPSPNIPVHVTYVWSTNDSTMRLYLNGSLAGARSGVSPSFQMPRGSGYLGNNASLTEGLIGTIHRVTVYSGILPDQTIQDHSDAFNGIHRDPEILTFTAQPAVLFTPETTTLQWETSKATTLLLDGQDVTSFSGITLQPQSTTTYTLVAINDSGSSTSSVQVVVNPAPIIQSFTSNPSIVPQGNKTTIHWSTLYAETLTLIPSHTSLTPLSSGTFEWLPTQNTNLQLIASNRFGVASLSLPITIVNPADHLVISEFLADNESSLTDEDGEHSDWIELFNPTAISINLQGYFLSDSPNDPTRWPFPTLTLAPGAFELVFASGKNRIDPTRPLHTNFKLGKDGGYLALFNASGSVIQNFNASYPPQVQDRSYGILGGDPELVRFFGIPTPKAENVETPIPPQPVNFSRASGTFTGSFALTLSSPTTNATIYYTLNGSMPSPTNGIAYSSPIVINTSRVVRALCLSSNLSSTISAVSYIRLAPDLEGYTSTLPIMVIENFGAGTIPQKGWSGDGSGIKQRPRQPAVWATFDRQNGTSTLTNAPQMLSRIGIRGRGAFSSSWRQPPYSVDSWDAADGDNNISPLGMSSHSEWILYFPDPDENKDPALLFNTFAYDLSRDMGDRYSVRFRWVEAFVNQDGGDLKLSDRKGVYAIVEKVARGKDRLDFQPLSDDGSVGGWLLSLNRMDPEPETGWPSPNGARQPWFFHTAGPNRKFESRPNSQVAGDDIPQQSNGYLNFDTPNGYTINTNQRAAIEGWFKQFEDVFYNNATWRHPTLGYRQYLDTRDFIDYFILNVLTHNGDGLLISMFPWKGDDNKLRMGPAWDYNWSAYYVSGSANVDLMHRSEQLWYPRLFNDPDFKQEYVDRWWQLRASALNNTNFDAIIDRQVADISPAKSVLNGMPSTQEWLSRINNLKTWLKTRANWIDSNYLRPPDFSSYGGLVENGFQLAISSTNGNIFFTLDGSDPRLSGGNVSTSAIPYSSTILINSQTTVKARVQKGANWSGLATVTFFTPQDFSQLALTEIHYNPEPNLNDPGDELEFIELQNQGSAPINLSGLRFTSGITFAFTNSTTLNPGDFFVLGRNRTALQNRYPGLIVHGLYTDKLSNSGETLTLTTAQGGTVLSVTYNDRAPWPLTPDGWGFSLVPKKGTQRNSNDGLDWRASSQRAGSPGTADPDSLLPALFINEIVTASGSDSDQIELFNPGNTPVNLSTWFLSDDATQPRKYQLSKFGALAPGAFLVLNEADFNANPGSSNSFSLSAFGESLYLSSGDAAGRLTGYTHGFHFDATEPGTSLGRYVNSVGQEHFPLQLTTTLGITNSPPRIGPIVFQEISYHPEIAEDEFVEIQNISDESVTLFHPAEITNTWRINGLDFSFPTNVTLAPKTIALITRSQPEVFRARFHIALNVPIFGPFLGALQANGETLKLQRPGSSTTQGVPYITVDEISYDDHFPWPPAADGTGASLQKRSIAQYGNDPAQWLAATPTPGAALPAPESPATITSQPQVSYPNSETAVLTVSATGTDPLSYQWLFQGSPIAEATSSTHRIAPLLSTDAGEYSVVVYNGFSSVVSSPVIVTIPERPDIYLQPQSRTVSVGQTASFTVGAVGIGTLSYQWFKDGSPIPSGTNSTLVLTNVQPPFAGYYQVIISTSTSRITSEPAQLSVIVKPSFITTLPDRTVVAGDNVTMSLQLAGTPPFTVRWRRGTVSIATVISESTSVSYTLTNIQVAQGAKYSAVASNPAGSNIPSNEGLITVLADSDRDHIPDVYENITPGLSSSVASDALRDFDQDGYSNLDEYRAGTDPNNASSFLKWESILPTTNGVILSFQAISNRTYSVQFRPNVDGSSWLPGWKVPALPQNRIEQIIDTSLTNEGRFYRLFTPE